MQTFLFAGLWPEPAALDISDFGASLCATGRLMQAVRFLPSVEGATLLTPMERQVAALSAGPPILIVTIDTEAEFDWNGPFLRTLTSVRNLRNQPIVQEVFDRFNVRPVYFVDYAVASQPEGYMPLLDIVNSGRCEIGAHLHPWITPPFIEELGERTSFSQNLTASLQREKLARLTEAITSSVGVRPVSYRAGRYGIGEELADILEALGYETDMSVQPGIDMRRMHGPDFRRALDRPYWFGHSRQLLEIPATTSRVGLLASSILPKTFSIRLYNRLYRPNLDRIRLRGALAFLRLIEQISLSPEGTMLGDLRRLTQAMRSRGTRLFVFSYHSSSLLPGNTEYVRSALELSQFIGRIEAYLEFFIGEMGGISMTASELRAALLREADTAAATVSRPLAAQ